MHLETPVDNREPEKAAGTRLAPLVYLGEDYLTRVESFASKDETRYSTGAYHLRALLRELREQRRLRGLYGG